MSRRPSPLDPGEDPLLGAMSGAAAQDASSLGRRARAVGVRAPPVESVAARLRAAGCVYAEDEAELLVREADSADRLAALVERRAAGEPLEHVLGWAEFCGLRVAVDRGVFVPRTRTELLAREAASLAPAGAVVVDLCCGSGAVGLAIASAVGGMELHAVDIDPSAVRCARRNLSAVRGHVHEGDLFEPLPVALRGRVDVLVANVPYVPTAALPLLPVEARAFEPLMSLDGGADGLDVLRRVAVHAPSWLASEGSLLVETSAAQVPTAVRILEGAGLHSRVATSDELEATVVVGHRR